MQQLYVNMGVMSPAYVAKIENLPEPEPQPAPPAPPPPPPPDDNSRTRHAWRRIVVDVVDRMTRMEAERARKAAKQGPEKFHVWAETFYPAHAVRLREALSPAMRSWCDVQGREGWEDDLEKLVEWMVARSREELEEARVSVLSDDVEARVERWERERPAEVADLMLGA